MFDHVGRTFGGRYRTERLLGRGGMGEVLEAVDIQTGDRVALKLLSCALTARDVERLRLEANIMFGLRHDHVARVLASRVDDDPPFIVMELLSGQTLAVRLRRGPLSTAHAVEIASQMLAGLAAAHAAGVVHRDVK